MLATAPTKWNPTTHTETGPNNGGGPLATVGLLGVGWWTARSAVRTLQETEKANAGARAAEIKASKQAREDSIRQTRPYVFAELVPSIGGTEAYDMVIRNLGRSIARDLVITFDPAPEHLDDVASKVMGDLKEKRDLPPSASLRTYWHLGVSEGQKLIDDEGNATTNPVGLPRAGTIRLSYTSDDESHPQYSEQYTFDAEKAGYWPVPNDGIEPGQNLGEQEKIFHSTLTAATRHLGMLRW